MKPRRTGVILFPLITFVALALSPVLRSQTVVYNSFGPGNSYNSLIAWGVSGSSATTNGYRGQAQFFVPSVSGYLDQIGLETRQISGSHLSNFFIALDNGSGIPGSILESWSNVTNPNGLLVITSIAQPLLQAGQTYWLCDEPATPTSYNAWYQNNQGISPGDAYDNSEWSWNTIPGGIETAGVFTVTVMPVPEPSTAALTLFGVMLLSRAGLFRSKSY